MKHFDKLYSSLVNESTYQGHSGSSIGDMLYDLLTSLDRDAKTRSGAMVSDVLKDIIDELNDIVENAERSSDSPEVQELVSRLKMD
jgi:hypothetical protein